MKGIKKGLAILLVLCTLLSMVVMTGAGTADASQGAQPLAASDSSFMKMVQLDGGRGYISVANVKAIIDEMALYDYDYLVLGFGNDGLRFLLDDMSVEANGTNYDGTAIKNAIIAKNKELAPSASGEWSQADMDAIIAYAQQKGISIVPFLNTPGHATSIVAAMTVCGIDAALDNRNGSTDNGSVTFDVTNSEAVAFVEALMQKYITYFSSKCQYFNLGMDEFAGNKGGWTNMSDDEKTALGTYLSDLVNKLDTARMTPMAFCDVIGNMSNVPNNLIGINWNGTSLSGHSNINANYNWYYVLGATGTGWAGYDKALSYTKSTPVTQTLGANANAGSLLAIWNDNYLAFDGYLDNVKTLIRTQATNNSNYFTTPEEREITVSVGKTATDRIEGGDFSNSVNTTNLDVSIATVAAEKTLIPGTTTYTRGDAVTSITSGEKYIIVNSKSDLTLQNETNETGLLLSNANTPTAWTITKSGSYYYVQNDSGYLSVGNASASVGSQGRLYLTYSSSNGGFWDIRTESKVSTGTWSSNYCYLNQYGGDNSTKAAGYTSSGSSDPGSRWKIYKAVEQTSQSADVTDVTFTGKSVGTTYVTVGNVHYTIHVTAEDLSTVTPLTVNMYISTYQVWDVSKYGYAASNGTPPAGVVTNVTISAEAAYGEKGIELSSVVPANGAWAWASKDAPTVFWKGVVLDGVKQSGSNSTDYSMKGTDYYYIRYYNGSWQYSADRETWYAVDSNDEVDAYYLMQTDVSQEVSTYVKDWAYTTQNASGKDQNRYQKALSFAVVYPSGQMSPAESDIYENSTLIYWDNLNPMTFIRVGVNEVYEVEKITYTFGDRQTSSSSKNWTASDSIKWEKTNVNGTDWYDETVCWDESYGTEPVVNGANLTNEIYANGSGDTNYTGTWGKNDAVLILIYLKPVVTEDSLTVRYWDDSANSEIYSYPVNISNTAGAEIGTFLNRLQQTSKVQAGDFTLDDDAYVVNAKNQEETFQKDLTKVPNLFGKYTSGLYDYVKADISADGKTLTLHYNLNQDALKPYYVVDFGLPVEIPFTDLGTGVTSVSVQQPANGTVKVEGNKIIYQPSKAYSGSVVLSVTATFSDGPQLYNVGIYPATTVYYEETFMEGRSATGTEPSQQSLAYGNNSAHVGKFNYGYDDAYKNDAQDSNGTVATLKTGDQDTFVFTGTGVDVYARSQTDSGKVMIYLYEGSGDSKTLKRLVTVDTRQLGNQSTEESNPNTAYNVPIVSLSGLTHGEYTIRMLAVQTKLADGTKASYDVYIDGFRVHGTLDVDTTQVYKDDGEASPTFVELRDSVLQVNLNLNEYNGQYADQIAENVMSQVYAKDNDVKALVINESQTGVGSTNVQDLLDNGPKNEVYLRKGESLVFTANATSAQIGLKALNEATSYKINDGGQVSLNTSIDMFYPLTLGNGTVTITNTGDGILSITELKLFGTGTSTASVQPMSAQALTFALRSLGYPAEPVEAAATLNITVQAGDKTLTAQLTASGIEGESHTFTAAEIQAAVEALELPEGYTLDGVTFEDVTVTCGEASDVSFTASEIPAPAPASPIQKAFQIFVKIVKKIFSRF